MSLDVYLKLPGAKIKRAPSSGIFIREGGQNVEIPEADWERRFPGRAPVRFQPGEGEETSEVFSGNITHNLGDMAAAANIYGLLWSPEECGAKVAKDLTGPLTEALGKLISRPEYYKTFNPKNGWGSYDTLLRFITKYLEACLKYPEAEISVSR